MKTATLLLTSVLLVGSAISANAGTIQNNDNSTYQLRIVEKGQENKIELQPSLEATDLCKTDCDLFLGDDPDPYVLTATDKFIIQDGQLYTAEELSRESETPKQ